MVVKKYVGTPSKLLVAATILSCALGGLDGRLVPWYNSTNLLKIW